VACRNVFEGNGYRKAIWVRNAIVVALIDLIVIVNADSTVNAIAVIAK